VKSSRSDKITAKPTPHARPFAGSDRERPSGVHDNTPSTASGLAGAWSRFWFAPIDPTGLHVVRVLTGLLLLGWILLTFWGNVASFVGPYGWMDVRAFTEASRLPGGELSPGWSVAYLCGGNETALTAFFWGSVAVLVLFTLGILPSVTAVLTWVVVASFTANPAFEYEGDALLLMLTFYLMVGYVLLGQRALGLSLPARLLGTLRTWPLATRNRDDGEPRPSTGANLALRLIQVHLAIVFVTTGLHKLQFGDWWAGVALWFPLHPPFKTTLVEALANKPYADTYLALLNVATYVTLAWQIGFPLFAWRPRWRIVLLGGAAVGWLATAFVWGLPVVGQALLIGCLSFVSPAGWQRILGWLPGKSRQQAVGSRQQAGMANPESVGAVS